MYFALGGWSEHVKVAAQCMILENSLQNQTLYIIPECSEGPARVIRKKYADADADDADDADDGDGAILYIVMTVSLCSV